MAITDVLNLTPEVVAEQNPELHEMRKIAFGENYLSDIAQGTGTAQYYTGWGNVPTVNFTPPVEEIAPVETDIVSAAPMITEPAGDAGIIAAGVEEPTPPFIETEPNVLTPPTLPGGAPISGPHGDYVITDPMTGDTYAPGDYTDVAGTLADPREKIDTLADTGGRDLPDVRQYADRSFGVDYEALDQEGQAEVDQAYADLYGIDTEVRQPFVDITPTDILTMGLGTVAEVPLNLIKTGIESLMPEEETTTYPMVTELPTAEDYGDPTIMDAPDITPLEVATGVVRPGDVDFSVDRTPENISQAVDNLAAQYDAEVAANERSSDPTVTSDVNKAKAVIDMPSHLGDVGQGEPMGRDDPTPPSRPGGAPASGPHGNGAGGGGGGGKIVCTMMNDSYGFGSFRNKIWLRQSKNLAPEYQIGYHKIFLPLVKLSKKNIVLKKILEHIAIHRTIDIRQEARGKTHMLGRVYRKILEPICYWVGKYGKRT